MNLAWNKVWPKCAHDFPGFAEDDINAIRNNKQDKASQETENEVDKEEEPVRGLDIECLGGIEKAPETLKECDPNPARSSKVAHDVEKSVKIYKKIYDEKTRKTKQSSIYLFFKPVRHAVPVTPADPATAGPSTSTADGSTAGPSSISSFFKPMKRADSATAGPSSISSFFKPVKCANPATAGPSSISSFFKPVPCQPCYS
ncbi:hypothetical protein E2C01_046270 [Portunus trituberculatus]|uniref:Uncharacterized protein n=1 Tax=Portunus trituberculatus TaxID=210409 RepID=A0A5B7G0I1_PORTR|nr:hypothetical protein [Portunus trituberculatus]